MSLGTRAVVWYENVVRCCYLSMRLCAAGVVACLAAVPGCPAPRPKPQQGPETVVRAFQDAQRLGQPGTAWVVSASRGGGLAPDLGPGAVGDGAASDEDVRGVQEIRRELRWGQGAEVFAVVRAPGAPPRLRLPRLAAMKAPSPQAAVALLAEALLARDYEALLALLPADEAARWTEARLAATLSDGRWEGLQAVARALQAGVTLPPGPHPGGTVEAQTKSGAFTVSLVRERGGWRVADLRPHRAALGAE